MRKRLLLIVAVIVMAFAGMSQTIPTKDEFISACDSLGIYHPYVVYAQARLESGNFTSAHYRNRNNCLGIYDSKRHCYAYFDSWIECLVAYRDRVQYKWPYVECTDEEYLKWVCNMGYAANPVTYEQHVLKILRQVKK